jgi:cation transport regulator ChaC
MSGRAWCWAWRPAARCGAWPIAWRPASGRSVYAYLREREQPTETYFEAWRDLKIDGEAGKTPALVFLSDMKHVQWAGALTLEQQAQLIAGAKGLSGRNIDYLSDLVGTCARTACGTTRWRSC